MMALLYTVYTKNSIVSPEKASEKIPLILQLFLDKAPMSVYNIAICETK